MEELSNIAWGAWEIASVQEETGVSFGLPDENQEVAFWRMDLPADPEDARGRLEGESQKLHRTQEALETMPGRFDSLAIYARGSRSAAYGVPSTAPGAAEMEALRLLDSIQPGFIPISFDQEDATGVDFNQAQSQFREGISRLLRLVTHLAWVETSIQGSLMARTGVNWTGDMRTIWEGRGIPDHLELHRRSLELALASRHSALRAFVITVQGALKIAGLLATPGGALMALPVAWRMTNQILSEVQQLKALPQA